MQNLGYIPLPAVMLPSSTSKTTPEHRFWRKYSSSPLINSLHAISCVSSNNNTSQIIAVGHGRSVSIIEDSKVIKEITSFVDNITAIAIRPDGQVMACADESGKI